MFKKVMVAVDGSETAQEALQEAHNIANSYQGQLCIVHVVGDDADDLARQAGNNVLEQAKSNVSGLSSIETRLLESDSMYGLTGIAEAIANAVNEWGANLLVVGTANRRGLERFVMGSVAEQVVAKVAASILLVRPR